MITVRMLGGARKSFPAGTVTVEGDGVTVSELFDMLAGHKPPETPDMDTENVLVAINGADSSVAGGRSAVIRDGDRVDIIPVIHGGSADVRFSVGDVRAAALRVPGDEADPVQLRLRHAGLHIQSIDSGHILGASHLRRMLEISVEAERRGTMLAERLETDIILRVAGTTQIAKAIRQAGVGAGRDAIVAALGSDHDLDALCESLAHAALPFPERTGETPDGFADVQVPLGRTLEEMLAERAAVL